MKWYSLEYGSCGDTSGRDGGIFMRPLVRWMDVELLDIDLMLEVAIDKWLWLIHRCPAQTYETTPLTFSMISVSEPTPVVYEIKQCENMVAGHKFCDEHNFLR